MPAALIATLGYSIASLGTWHATLLWGVSMLIALMANRAYTELAAMFPEKPGGISLYATEGWRSRFALAGPVATFGYWFAWSSSMAVYSGIVGSLAQAQWFPAETWVRHVGPVDVTFPRRRCRGRARARLGGEHARPAADDVARVRHCQRCCSSRSSPSWCCRS